MFSLIGRIGGLQGKNKFLQDEKISFFYGKCIGCGAV